MKFNLSKIISFLLSVFFLIIFFYLIFRSVIISDSFFSIYTVYLIINLLLIFFWVYIFFTKNNKIRILSIIYFIAIITPFYGFEVLQNYPQIKLVFKDFDTRTKRAVYNDVSKNRKVVPTAPLDNDVISGKNSDLYPLAGFPNEYTLFCNEHGQYVFYDSDRYGFRNNDNLWDKKIDAVLLGDSFAHGACVENAISENLNAVKNFNIINLGYQGNGPLKMYGALKEYGVDLEPKYIVWMYDSFNDIDDLVYELENEILNKYLDKDYKQNLKKISNKVNNFLGIVLREKLNHDFDLKFSHTIKLYKTRRLIISLFKQDNGYNFDNEIEKFKIIFDNTIELSNEIDSEIIFVFFSELDYLRLKDYINADKKILEYIDSKNIKKINIYEIMKNNSNFETFFPFEGKYHFGHFNEKGYKIVSDEIKKIIIDK